MAELIAAEPPALVLDAASPVIRVGLQRATPVSATWRETAEEAGVGLFQTAEVLLREHNLRLADLRTIIFCEGPGSLLGIRLAAIALRTWKALPRPQPVRLLSYRSLELMAASLLDRQTKPPFVLIHDARRQTWNVLEVDGDGTWGEFQRRATDALPQGGRLFHPTEFPHWQELPAGADGVDYHPAELLRLAQRFPLLREAPSPDAFLIERPTYKTWQPDSASAPPP